MTDYKRGENPTEIAETLPPGSVLIFRHYQIKKRESLAQDVISKCRKNKIFCLIGGDFRLAIKLKADGVHLPENFLKRMGKRPPVPRSMIITAATHSFTMVLKAKKLRLDAAILSPVFSTKSHPERKPLGFLQFASICKRSKIPVVALGGVPTDQILRCIYAGASGISGIDLLSSFKIKPHARN